MHYRLLRTKGVRASGAAGSKLSLRGPCESVARRSMVVTWVSDGFREMRGFFILLVSFAIMVSARGQLHTDLVPRPTAPVPPVNAP